MAYELFPAVDEDYNFPPEVRAALAASVELRNTVLPLTQTQRNNLTGTDLWDGRLVLNTTTDRLNRYDGGTATWKAIADSSEVTALAGVVSALDSSTDSRLDGHDSAIAGHESRLDTLDTGFIAGYNAARVRSTSAGLQDNGSGRKFYDVGFSFRREAPVVSFARSVSGTLEVDGKIATGFLSYGIIFVTGGDLSLGLPSFITVID